MLRPKSKEELVVAANVNYEKLLSLIEKRTDAEINTSYDFSAGEKKKEALDTFSQEELFINTFYPWVGGSCIGSYLISNTSSHYDWAMKKIKAHQKSCK